MPHACIFARPTGVALTGVTKLAKDDDGAAGVVRHVCNAGQDLRFARWAPTRTGHEPDIVGQDRWGATCVKHDALSEINSSDPKLIRRCYTGCDRYDRKALLRNLPLLQDRLTYYRSRRDESLRVFVSGITGQTGERLEVLLAVAGLTEPRISQSEGARRLGVVPQRMHQLLGQLWRAWDKATPPAGVWQLQEWADRVCSSGLSRRRSG